MTGIPSKTTYSVSFATPTTEGVDVMPDDMSEGTVKEGSGQDGDLDLSTPGPEDDVNYDAWRHLEDLMELPNMDVAIAHRRLLRQRLS